MWLHHCEGHVVSFFAQLARNEAERRKTGMRKIPSTCNASRCILHKCSGFCVETYRANVQKLLQWKYQFCIRFMFRKTSWLPIERNWKKFSTDLHFLLCLLQKKFITQFVVERMNYFQTHHNKINSQRQCICILMNYRNKHFPWAAIPWIFRHQQRSNFCNESCFLSRWFNG